MIETKYKMDNYTSFTKSAFMIILFTLISLLYSGESTAAVFNVYTVVCAPDWYCTAFDNSDCGTRTCIDTNACGTNIGRPIEYIECDEEEPSGGGSGGSGGGGSVYVPSPIMGLPSPGYFTLSTDNIKVTIEQGIVVQKIISLNGTTQMEYHLEIKYPSSYPGGTGFITTTTETKSIEKGGDFNIIIDSREVTLGTYVIPVKVYNENYSKTVGLTIDVIPQTSANIEITLDSRVKNIGMDKEIVTFIKTKGLEYINTTFIYNIMDPLGNIIATEEKEVDDPTSVEHILPLPESLGEGYYTVSVKIQQKGNAYIKSEQFTMLTPNKYMSVIESPRRNLTLWIWLIIIIASAVTLFNTGLFYKSYAPTRHKISRNINGWRLTHSPSMGIKEKITAMFKPRPKEEKILDVGNRMSRLKESYEGGFITAKEYKDIAKRYGYNIGVTEKTTDKENIEAALKKNEERAKEETKKIDERKEEKKIPITLSNAINIPVDKESQRQSKEEVVQEIKSLKQEPLLEKEEKKAIIETPIVERPIASESVGGAIAHMFAQSILDKKAHLDQAFILNDHEKLYSLRDLMEALPRMPIPIFEHHTRYGRNDFSNWIGDVFQYYDVAEDIRGAKTREELIEKLQRYA